MNQSINQSINLYCKTRTSNDMLLQAYDGILCWQNLSQFNVRGAAKKLCCKCFINQ